MIDLTPTDEQAQLIDWARGFIEHRLALDLVGGAGEVDVAAVMRELGDIGWFAPAKSHAGRRVVDEALLYRELGRGLVPGPVLATALAARSAAAAGATELASALAEGRTAACLTHLESDERIIVWDAGMGEFLLVVEPESGQVCLADVPPLTLAPTIDPFRQIGFAPVSQLKPKIVVPREVGEEVRTLGRILTAAMLVGIAEQTRDDSAAYAKHRVQFGVPIGTFQAVKHRCADMALRAERAWAQTAVAALLVESGEAILDVAAAKAVAGAASIQNARDNIQNQGGFGYTAESTAHLLLKRAHTLDNTFGDIRSLVPCLLEGGVAW